MVKQIELDNDNYSILNLSLSSGIARATYFSVMAPLEMTRVRGLTDMKQCDPVHYSNKSVYGTFLGKNKGPTQSCFDCLKSTNPLKIVAEITKKEGFTPVLRSIPHSMLMGFSKSFTTFYIYEQGNF